MKNKYDSVTEPKSVDQNSDLSKRLSEINQFVALLANVAQQYSGTGQDVMSSIYSILDGCSKICPSNISGRGQFH